MNLQKIFFVLFIFVANHTVSLGKNLPIPYFLSEAKVIGVWKMCSAVDKSKMTNITEKVTIQSIVLTSDHIYTIVKTDKSTSTGIWKLTGSSIQLNADPDYTEIVLDGNKLKATLKLQMGKRKNNEIVAELEFMKAK